MVFWSSQQQLKKKEKKRFQSWTPFGKTFWIGNDDTDINLSLVVQYLLFVLGCVYRGSTVFFSSDSTFSLFRHSVLINWMVHFDDTLHKLGSLHTSQINFANVLQKQNLERRFGQ